MTSGLCNMEIARPHTVRRRCPACKRRETGTLRSYYDTVRLFFRCGAWIDYGYGTWWRGKGRSQS